MIGWLFRFTAKFRAHSLVIASVLIGCWLGAAPVAAGEQAKHGSHGHVVYTFLGASDGFAPSGTLTADSFGNLFGTTQYGGDTSCFVNEQTGCGTVFELVRSGKKYIKQTLYNFRGGSDGAEPQFGVIADAAGALYGTTAEGGGGCQCGTVFKLTPNGSTYSESILHEFGVKRDGMNPYAGLTMDANGVLYGTLESGGKSGSGYGAVFSLAPQHRKRYIEKILHYFSGGADGGHPAAPVLVQGNALIGTTRDGGTRHDCACGTVFALTPGTSGYTETVLYSFGATLDGSNPAAGVSAGPDGVLYGTTELGGRHMECIGGCGTLYSLTPTGSAYTEAILWNFEGAGIDGGGLQAGVIVDSRGHFYGTAPLDGTGPGCHCGVAYEVSPSGSLFKEKILIGFNGTDGQDPWGGLVEFGGVLYGTTIKGGGAGYGTVFAVAP